MSATDDQIFEIEPNTDQEEETDRSSLGDTRTLRGRSWMGSTDDPRIRG